MPYCVAKAGSPPDQGNGGELRCHGIRVNAIVPGFIPTDMTGTLQNFPEIMDRMLVGQPIGRFGKLEEIKGPILFLASEASLRI